MYPFLDPFSRTEVPYLDSVVEASPDVLHELLTGNSSGTSLPSMTVDLKMINVFVFVETNKFNIPIMFVGRHLPALWIHNIVPTGWTYWTHLTFKRFERGHYIENPFRFHRAYLVHRACDVFFNFTNPLFQSPIR